MMRFKINLHHIFWLVVLLGILNAVACGGTLPTEELPPAIVTYDHTVEDCNNAAGRHAQLCVRQWNETPGFSEADFSKCTGLGFEKKALCLDAIDADSLQSWCLSDEWFARGDCLERDDHCDPVDVSCGVR